MKSLGTNIMLVLPGAVTASGVRLAQTGQTLTEEDGAPSRWRCPRCRPPRPACAPRAGGGGNAN